MTNLGTALVALLLIIFAQRGDGQFRDATFHGRPVELANRLHHDRLPLLGLDLWTIWGATGARLAREQSGDTLARRLDDLS
jgi:hypothetical protein